MWGLGFKGLGFGFKAYGSGLGFSFRMEGLEGFVFGSGF